jgi:hypothetical protein
MMKTSECPTPAQSKYFYIVLRELVIAGDVPYDHPLRQCPLDPFQKGNTRLEAQAVAQLEKLAGRYASQLRRLYYGYCLSGKRHQNLETGIAFLTMWDSELCALLRSHQGDETTFPTVFFPDEQAEARHYAMLRQLVISQFLEVSA